MEFEEAFWYLAAERQAMLVKRLRGQAWPWSSDSILNHFRFAPVFRTDGRTTQYLIRLLGVSPEEDWFRIVLFRVFNRIETWEYLQQKTGGINRENFDVAEYVHILMTYRKIGERLFAPRSLWKFYAPLAIYGKTPAIQHTKLQLALTAVGGLAEIGELVMAARTMQQARNRIKFADIMDIELYENLVLDSAYSPFTAYKTADAEWSPQLAFDACDTSRGFAWEDAKPHRSYRDRAESMVQDQEREFAKRGLEFLSDRKMELTDVLGVIHSTGKYLDKQNGMAALPYFLGSVAKNRRYTPNPEPLGEIIVP